MSRIITIFAFNISKLKVRKHESKGTLSGDELP